MAVMHQNRKNSILLGQNNNALTWLIIINAVAFVIIKFIQVVYQNTTATNAEADALFQRNVLDWLALPASFDKLLTRPWTIVTFMFTHGSILDLVSTTLWLWSFGYILQDLSGNSKLIPIYLYGGVAAGLVFMLSVYAFPGLRHQIENIKPLLSGSAPVMAVAIAVTALSPGYRLFPMLNGGFPLWILTTVFVIIAFTANTGNGAGFAMAQLGAGFTGFLFIHQLRRGRDWGNWMAKFVTWVDNLFNPEKRQAEQDPKQKLFYKATKKPYVKKAMVTQQRVDDLLDKINQKGYHFLTDEERDFLKKASEQDL